MLREATMNDCEALAKVHVDSWMTTYKGLVPNNYLSNFSYNKSEEMFKLIIEQNINKLIVYELNDSIVGFVCFGKERTNKYDYKGEIQSIYLLEPYQRQGIGRQLFKEAIKGLIKQDINSLMIWVLKNNKSRYFYKKMGGKIVDEMDADFNGVLLKEVAFAWEDITSI